MKKKFIYFFVFLFLCSYSFADVAKDQFFTIDDFSKMLQSHTSPYSSDPSSANDLLNVRANEQYGSLVKRNAMYSFGTCHSSPIKSLHRFYKSDSTKYLISTSSTYISLCSDSDGTCQDLKTTATDSKRFKWVTYKDLAIGVNGSDASVKYDGKSVFTDDTDGARTSGDGVAELGAPFAELNTGTDLDASSWYMYKIAFYDGSTYKYSTARSNPIKTGATVYNITLTDIPLGPTGTTHRYIYRTVGNSSRSNALADTSYYLLADISNNTTRTYDDSVSDTTLLGDSTPKWSTVSAGTNVTPPKTKYLTIHKERLFLAHDPSGTASGKSIVYFSDLLNPDYFNYGTNYFLIRPDDGDDITFIDNYLGMLTVGKNNTISKIFTDSTTTSNWQVSPPFSFVGCVAPYSAQTTPIGIVYLGRYGLYKFDGQSSQLISDAVTKDIRDISQSNLLETVSIYYNNQYEISYTSTETGSSRNNRVLIFDIVRNSYVKDSKDIDSYVVFNSGTDYGEIYSGSSNDDGKILSHTYGLNNLFKRYKSECDAGTTDSAVVLGEELAPTISLGWGITINSTNVSGVSIDTASATATIDRGSDTGYWYSPAYEINANALSKLYWNASEGMYGNVSIAIRLASTAAGLTSASWSSEYTTSSGSDISAVTSNNFIQFRIKMTTSDMTDTPFLYVSDDFLLKLTYSKIGTISETSVLSMWKSAWLDLNAQFSNYPKILREMDVYYEGTSGTVTFQVSNLKGDIISTFDIDLSHSRQPSSGYFGSGDSKVFRYNFPTVSTSSNFTVGDKFQILITDTGTTSWKIQKITLRYDVTDYVPYK